MRDYFKIFPIPQTPLHLERGFRSTMIDLARNPEQSPKPTPSPRGEGRGEVKKKGNQPQT